MLQIFANGYLGQNATMQGTENDSQIVFSMAHTEKYKNQNGDITEKTVWLNCYYYSKSESLKTLLTKGSLVSILGTFNVSSYIDGNGNAKHIIYVNVSKLDILTANKTVENGK